jgi:hypothetical protein
LPLAAGADREAARTPTEELAGACSLDQNTARQAARLVRGQLMKARISADPLMVRPAVKGQDEAGHDQGGRRAA